MNRYLDAFLIAAAVFGAAALIYNVHKYGLTPTLEAIKKGLGIAEKAAVGDAEAIYMHIGELFQRHTSSVAAATTAAVKDAISAMPPAKPNPVTISLSPGASISAPGPSIAGPSLPAVYLLAEQNARPELDHPDHVSLAALLAMPVEAAGRLVAATSDAVNLNLREALIRAARILDPNTYVAIGNEHAPNWSGIVAAIQSPCPVMRRFGSSIWAIAIQTIEPPSLFPANLGPDGDVIYVPYDAASKANVTLESVGAAAPAP